MALEKELDAKKSELSVVQKKLADASAQLNVKQDNMNTCRKYINDLKSKAMQHSGAVAVRFMHAVEFTIVS